MRFFYLCIIVSVSGLKLWWIAGEPLLGIHPSGHDDRLFLQLAEHLITGEWLGAYNSLTLIKGVGYPVWLAFSYGLGLPLHMSQGLLYLLSGLVLLYALRQLGITLGILTGLYILFLFNPMVETYVTRDGIYPALTVFVVAGLIGWQTSIQGSVRQQLTGSIFLGFSLTGFWLTREEGVWLLPTLFVYMGYIIGYSIIKKRQEIANKQWLSAWIKNYATIVLIPFMILFIGIQSCAVINYWYYGTYTVIELQSQPFTTAYGALTRVKAAQWQARIPVSKEVREQVYAVSPAFRELQPWLEGDFERLWTKGNDKEIEGSVFVWALRGAVVFKGDYRSAAAANAYYARLADEINTACALKRLTCLPERATLTPPWHTEYLSGVLFSLWFTIQSVVRFQHLPHYSPKHAMVHTLSPVQAAIVQGRWIRLNPDDFPRPWNDAKVHFFYRWLIVCAMGIILVIYGATNRFLFQRFAKLLEPPSVLWSLNIAMAMAIVARCLLVAVIDTTAWELIIDPATATVAPSFARYLLPVYPLLLIWLISWVGRVPVFK